MRQVSRGEQGWTFTYICKDSWQAWSRQVAKNPAKTVIGEWSEKIGQDPVHMGRFPPPAALALALACLTTSVRPCPPSADTRASKLARRLTAEDPSRSPLPRRPRPSTSSTTTRRCTRRSANCSTFSHRRRRRRSSRPPRGDKRSPGRPRNPSRRRSRSPRRRGLPRSGRERTAFRERRARSRRSGARRIPSPNPPRAAPSCLRRCPARCLLASLRSASSTAPRQTLPLGKSSRTGRAAVIPRASWALPLPMALAPTRPRLRPATTICTLTQSSISHRARRQGGVMLPSGCSRKTTSIRIPCRPNNSTSLPTSPPSCSKTLWPC